MRNTLIFAICASAVFTSAMTPRSISARTPTPQKKEYLSDEEADKIRNADSPNMRVKLYLTYAADRLKKFQYELDRTMPQSRRGETLNGLLNAYSGCIDDAADVISLAVEKQQDIRTGIKEMQSKGKEYLATLEKIQQKGTDLESYKETLEDAMDGTKDAISDAAKSEKEMAPPPVRRPQ
jgi:chromosome segregation ATPase